MSTEENKTHTRTFTLYLFIHYCDADTTATGCASSILPPAFSILDNAVADTASISLHINFFFNVPEPSIFTNELGFLKYPNSASDVLVISAPEAILSSASKCPTFTDS